MSKTYFNTDDKTIFLTVDEEKIEIKKRRQIGKPKKLWKVFIPKKSIDEQWNCVDYVAFNCDGFRSYNEYHKNYVPACDLLMLKSEIEKKLKINLPIKAFEKFIALSITKALVNGE